MKICELGENTLISLADASKFLGITASRLRQIINEEKVEVAKGSGIKGKVSIPNKTMARLNELRGIEFEPRIGTIGVEKGGVGKTTTTMNIAAAAARRGISTCCLDFDPECCLSQYLFKGDIPEGAKTILDVFEENGQIVDYTIPTSFDGIDMLPSSVVSRRVEVLIADKNPATLLKSKLIGMKEKYDLILIDVPPAWNKLTSSAYLSSDFILMPVFPDIFSLDSLKLSIDDIEKYAEEYCVSVPEIRIFKNRYGEKRKNSRDLDEELLMYGSKVLNTYIKSSSIIEDCVNASTTVFDSARKDYLPFAVSFNEILNSIYPAVEK